MFNNEKDIIKSEKQPNCIFCGKSGNLVYRDISDEIFGTAGYWDLRKCKNPLCRLIWLDPMPLDEDIGKAYANYYTHRQIANQGQPKGPLKNIYRIIKKAYLKHKYGYPANFSRHVGKILYLFPIRRKEVEKEVRFLTFSQKNMLFDVGCGDGEWLDRMRYLGWHTEGVDFDETAVQRARDKGLDVHCGKIDALGLAGNKFDVITMNHVIEHVPNPKEYLMECRRMLKSGGRIFINTPNVESIGHRLFKASWRGLEPPRHLYLYNPHLMNSLLTKSGFTNIRIQTINSKYIFEQSLNIRKHRIGGILHSNPAFRKLTLNALVLLEQVMLVAIRYIGEDLVVEAIKD